MSEFQNSIRVPVDGAMTRDYYYHGRGERNGLPVNWRPDHHKSRRTSKVPGTSATSMEDEL